MFIYLLTSIVIITIIFYLLQEHLKEKERILLKEVNVKLYGDILQAVNEAMVKKITATKVLFGLVISSRLIHGNDTSVFSDYVANEIKKQTLISNESSLFLLTEKFSSYTISPQTSIVIKEYCKKINSVLDVNPISIIPSNLLTEECLTDTALLSKIQQEVSEHALTKYYVVVDNAHKVYQDLCADILK